jgi:hypothetical protein
VLLAVIGPRWISIQDDAGLRRLDDPTDYIRLELATALGRANVRVIPVLVDGATMPALEALPADLKPLARRNALELTDKRWDYDVSQLVATLRRSLGLVPGIFTPSSWRWLGAGLAALLVAIVAFLVWHSRKSDTPPGALPSAVPTPSGPIAGVPASPDPGAAAQLGAPAPPGPQAQPAVNSTEAEPCPTRLSINRELPTPFTCMCDAQKVQEGAVWGTDTYTDDSSLCRAAVHAGAIPATGGAVTVLRSAGRPLYVGSRRNGIQSSDYGAYSDGIHFQAK